MVELRASPFIERVPPIADAGLAAFLADYCAGGRIRIAPPQDGILFDAGVTSIVLYREGEYQVEMIVVAPGVRIPPHVHDDVDSYEVAFSGAMELFVAEEQCCHLRAPRADGLSRNLLRFVPIRSDAVHHGNTHERGAVFLSVQRWRDGVKPSHVGLNWRGPRVGEQ